ncbi:MAG: (2Fe-2S)-binding protein [Candidatus Angelobacter sp.]
MMSPLEQGGKQVTIAVNKIPVTVAYGTTVAVAIARQGVTCRRSVSGQLRGPLCGMGICFECRVEINGRRHCRSCQIICEPGMKVQTDA